MTNEELMIRLAEGDESVLETLCENNKGLIRDRTRRMAEAYHCIRTNDRGQWSGHTKETLSELESVGMTAFLECIRSGKYDSAQGGSDYIRRAVHRWSHAAAFREKLGDIIAGQGQYGAGTPCLAAS